MSNKTWAIATGAVAVAASGCVSVPEFESASRIDRPRVLAVVAEPPAVAPGEPVALSLLRAGFDDMEDVRIEWSACAAFFTTIRGAQYGDGPDDQGCSGELGAPLAAVADSGGERARLPGAVTAGLFDNLDIAAAALGAVLPPETIELVKREVGLPLLVEARITYRRKDAPADAPEQVYRAVKRVLINAERQHDNPPPPAFALRAGSSERVVRGVVGSFDCAAVDGGPLQFRGERELELAPLIAEGDDALTSDYEQEPWLEDYVVLNARGELVPRQERAFYSWFSDGGDFEQEITKSPLRNELWNTPNVDGQYSLWVVVRDGHGGASACRVPVMIGPQETD